MRRQTDAFDAAGRVLLDAAGSAFPAAVAEVGNSGGIHWQIAAGRLHTDPSAPTAALDTIFDLASLSKPVVTTTVAMRLVAAGRLDLEAPLGRLLPEWRGSDRDAVTVRDLLEHASGLTAHLPLYRDAVNRAEYEALICRLPLEYTPRSRSIYSDLGFILLGFIIQDVGGVALDVAFADVRAILDQPELRFRPEPVFRGRIAPTGFDKWRGRVLVGEVHDRNAWALGGVAGHAGLFGTAPALGTFARALLATLRDGRRTTPLLPYALARKMATRTSVPGSSRALGWDMMRPTSSCGTLMHPTAIGHTGYTGTSLWIDAVNDAYVVLLTNRVHPTDENQQIVEVRRRFHDAAMTAVRS
jgi:CubicO group peptidase (beta-lactamase class C family)